MDPLIILSLLLGFFISLFFIPLWIKGTKRAGLLGKDMHKKNGGGVSESGGVGALIGFIAGVLCYIAVKIFYFNSEEFLIEIFSILSCVMMIGFVGLMDDILGWKIGLTKKTRILFLIFGAIPLMVVNAGESTMVGIRWGLIYPLFFIPLGIVGASTTFNFLAGYNGLEARQGILILGGLAVAFWMLDKTWLSVISGVMIASLCAFYIFNKNPAKVFPGDVLTYSVGALIAALAIVGNVEKIAVFFFIPYILETGLKCRGKLKKESFAKVKEDGSLEEPYKKIYGLEHLAIRILKRIKPLKKVYENDVVNLINLFQVIVIIAGLVFLIG